MHQALRQLQHRDFFSEEGASNSPPFPLPLTSAPYSVQYCAIERATLSLTEAPKYHIEGCRNTKRTINKRNKRKSGGYLIFGATALSMQH